MKKATAKKLKTVVVKSIVKGREMAEQARVLTKKAQKNIAELRKNPPTKKELKQAYAKFRGNLKKHAKVAQGTAKKIAKKVVSTNREIVRVVKAGVKEANRKSARK